MSPPKLLAEGPMPGRPKLLGATIATAASGRPVQGEVVHEDPSGIVLASEGSQIPVPYPFVYVVIKDPLNGNNVP